MVGNDEVHMIRTETASILTAYGFNARKDLLTQLLALNLARAAEEAKAAKVKQPKASREKHADEML